jgi:hypothetical protein
VWSTQGNWLGNRVPDAGDDVYIINQSVASSASINFVNGVARNVFIDEGNAVGVFGARSLLVGDDIHVLDGQLRANDAASFIAADRIDLGPGSEVDGAGLVDVAIRFASSGLVQGLNNGTLRLESNAAFGVFDLDGAPDFPFAGVQAISGNVDVSGHWLDPFFDGVVEVGTGRTFSFDQELHLGGAVDLIGNGSPATISGPTLLEAVVQTDGEGRFAGETTIDSAWLQMPDSNDELVFAGITNYLGGFVTGDGIMTQTGNAFVQDDFTIDCATFDWDGENGNSITTIWNGRTLTINSGKIENSQFLDGFDGTLNMLGATLNVNTSTQWRLDGTIFMNIPVGLLSVIGGNNMDVEGLVRVSGVGWMEAEVDILPGGEISTANADAIVVFNSTQDNAIDQGSITGPGTLTVTAGRELVGRGAIATEISGMGTIRAENGTLHLNGPMTLIGVVGTQSNTGVLNVSSQWTTGAGGEINLRGGSITGGAIQCNGRITGNGAVDVPEMELAGLLSPGDPGIGVLVFTEDLTMYSDATTVIEVNGPMQGTSYDFVRVFGNLRPAGLLRIIKAGSYDPACGTEFHVMSHTSLLDQFDSYTGLNLGDGRRFFVSYAGNFVTLRVVPQGDLDGDGSVGQSDLGIVLADFGCAGPQHCPGDLDEDGETGQGDLGILLAAYGQSCP